MQDKKGSAVSYVCRHTDAVGTLPESGNILVS